MRDTSDDDDAITPEWVERRLLEAGRTLWKMRGRVGPVGYRSNMPDVVQDFWEVYGQHEVVARQPIPSPAEIGRMDEAFGWLSLVKDPRHRRVVSLALFNHPDTHRKVFSDRKIAKLLKTSNHTVKSWNSSGLSAISMALAKKAASHASHFLAPTAA